MSESEEMYLVTIARLIENGIEGPIPLSTLAAEMDLLPVSVNQMIRKLEEVGLVEYTPYRGVALTPSGNKQALHILRLRRLWEVFLVERLFIPPTEASELACRMEHIIPDQAAERLAIFLGNPIITPQGKSIPGTLTECCLSSDIPLKALAINQCGTISRVQNDTPSRSFLASEGILPGAVIRLVASNSHGALLLISDVGGKVTISDSIADTIWVNPKE